MRSWRRRRGRWGGGAVMTTKFEADYIVTEKIFIATIQRLSLRQQRVITPIALICCVYFALADGGMWIYALAVYILIVIGTSVIYIPKRAKALYRDQPANREMKHLDLADRFFAISSTSLSINLELNNVVRWDETPSVMMIFLNRCAAMPVPKAVLSRDALKFMRARLIASGLKRGTRRKVNGTSAALTSA